MLQQELLQAAGEQETLQDRLAALEQQAQVAAAEAGSLRQQLEAAREEGAGNAAAGAEQAEAAQEHATTLEAQLKEALAAGEDCLLLPSLPFSLAALPCLYRIIVGHKADLLSIHYKQPGARAVTAPTLSSASQAIHDAVRPSKAGNSRQAEKSRG